jgi:hypothetical protein
MAAPFSRGLFQQVIERWEVALASVQIISGGERLTRGKNPETRWLRRGFTWAPGIDALFLD